MNKLSCLQEVLSPTRRREEGGRRTEDGGEAAWLSLEYDEGCNGNGKAEGNRDDND